MQAVAINSNSLPRKIGKMSITLYSSFFDPLDNAVRMVAEEKEIVYDLKLVSERELPDEVMRQNPYRNILTLLDRHFVLYDGRVIMEYLDERFPYPPLLPIDPASRARDRQLRYHRIEEMFECFRTLDDEGMEEKHEQARKKIRESMSVLAQKVDNNTYIGGNDICLADFCIAPMLWRLNHYNVKLPSSAQRTWNRYGKHMFAKESFVRSLSDQERELQGKKSVAKVNVN